MHQTLYLHVRHQTIPNIMPQALALTFAIRNVSEAFAKPDRGLWSDTFERDARRASPGCLSHYLWY